jgi:hypothetical protein
LFLQKHGPYDFVWRCNKSESDFKVMQRNFLNYVGHFGTPVFVILAVYIPV